ncbi:MAG: hypothetical protein NTX72_04345 [Candidatus Uhrbacteria bacterium]|nr:hypothetical protein [Candidatus Uhrbacteria bacterium]
MYLEKRREGIIALAAVVHRMGLAGIDSREKFREWAKTEHLFLVHAFNYPIAPGMPSIYSLFAADFHPELPLVMFNYTPTAHNTLHAHPEGWTNALRMCRGIVFEMGTGKLIAHPFPKFFNLNEHPETVIDTLIEKLKTYRDDSYSGWYATRKMDGHLGIIFEYHGKLHFTTRGTFGSPSAKLGTKLLRQCEREFDWKKNFDPNFTTLVELVDPSTKVHVNYGAKSGFVLLGAYNRETLVDASMIADYVGGSQLDNRAWLPIHASRLQMKMGADVYLCPAHANGSDNLNVLVASMKNRDVVNEEGWVIRLFDGTRVKVKYETYIGLMVQKKLSPTYIMNRVMAGNLEKMLNTLDEEVVPAANEMYGRIMRVVFMTGENKVLWNYLYGLVPPEASTPHYRGICRKFLAYIDDIMEK